MLSGCVSVKYNYTSDYMREQAKNSYLNGCYAACRHTDEDLTLEERNAIVGFCETASEEYMLELEHYGGF